MTNTVPIPIDHLTAQQASQQTLTEILSFIHEWRTSMATLNESIDRLFTDFSNELQQIRDGLAATLATLTEENADLRAQIQASLDQVDAAQTRLDEKSTELEANDPPANDG